MCTLHVTQLLSLSALCVDAEAPALGHRHSLMWALCGAVLCCAGDEDIMPHLGGGGLGGMGGVGGGMLPPGPGGGMHVGPGHPFFADR